MKQVQMGCLLWLCAWLCIANLASAQELAKQVTGQVTEQAARQSAPQLNTAQAQQIQDQQREEARRWLERMALAMEQLNYRGTFAYSHSGRLQSLAVIHMRDAKGVRERLYSLEGDTREVRRNNDLVHALAPEQDQYSQMNYRQFTRLPSSQLLQRKSRYNFVLGGQQRIASLPAQQIRIVPNDGFRYGYELWLEKNTGMLLKQVMVNEQQQVLEKLVFTHIELGAEIKEQDLPEAARAKADEADSSAGTVTTVEQLHWQPAQVPNGFELLAHHHSQTQVDGQSNGSSEALEHLLYSDGLAHVSVYLEAHSVESDDVEYPASRYGVVNIYSRSIDGMHITAMGAVPYRTLRMIGGSMYNVSQLQPANQNRQDNANPGQ